MRRPTVVEFSPYGNDSRSAAVSDAYNFLLVQIRGTGDSDGSFDALGPRTQAGGEFYPGFLQALRQRRGP